MRKLNKTERGARTVSKAQTILIVIQTILFIVALVLLAVNKHESFQDFMIFSMFCGGLADNRKLKNDGE